MIEKFLIPILVTRENISDVDFTIVSTSKINGDKVIKGEVIGVYESSKALIDVEAPSEGYVFYGVSKGCNVSVGSYFAVISSEATLPAKFWEKENVSNSLGLVAMQSKDVRISKSAQKLMDEFGLSHNDFADKKMITQQDIITYIDSRKSVLSFQDKVNSPELISLSRRVLIVGAGKGSVLAADIISRTPFLECAGLLDDREDLQGQTIWGMPVLGRISDAVELYKSQKYSCAVITVTSHPNRKAIFDTLRKAGVPFINLIDPSVTVCSHANIGEGNVIMGHCRIGPFATIGNNNFLSAYVNIEHHNTVRDHCTFGPCVSTSGDVHIGNSVLFGTGIFIEPGINIGDCAIVSSGAVLKKSVKANSIVKIKASTTIISRG